MSYLMQLSFLIKKIQQLGFRLGPSVYARHTSLLCRCITRVLKIVKRNKELKEANLSDFNDNGLLRLLAQSDKDAFSAIYDRYAPTLYLYIINQVCTRTTAEQAQEDTTQIMIKIFASLWHNRKKPMGNTTLQEHLLFIADSKLFSYTALKEALIS